MLLCMNNLINMEKTNNALEKAKKVPKGWLESLKTQGAIIINDPQLALCDTF